MSEYTTPVPRERLRAALRDRDDWRERCKRAERERDAARAELTQAWAENDDLLERYDRLGTEADALREALQRIKAEGLKTRGGPAVDWEDVAFWLTDEAIEALSGKYEAKEGWRDYDADAAEERHLDEIEDET